MIGFQIPGICLLGSKSRAMRKGGNSCELPPFLS